MKTWKTKPTVVHCQSILWHGNGHQSQTKCQVEKHGHTEHQAYYGSCEQYATWTGSEAVTGFFDEPPQHRS